MASELSKSPVPDAQSVREQSLAVSGLACERDGRLLFEGLEFTLAPGAAVQVEGANGAGKSTLIRTLIGSASDFTGTIAWQGLAFPRGLAAMRASLLYIGHYAGVRRGLTPLENLAWYGAGQDDAMRALELVGLYGFEDVLCQQLSAGQNRRVALARLYLPDSPPLWILDEPLAALDVTGVAGLETQMNCHLRRGGSVLLTSHQPVNIAPLQRVNLADFSPRMAVEEELHRAV
ncbi:cytochrome c biogenesis heme-transporting ATPase CcmA [Microbulbifer harenosus]|uniref:Cytochrome c biogenesis heme-transporting ATPase CcmA n=1 Tax=Microbulbifer harenosus TaxID=2576840 RepID=A0ABY2ULD5_9GAMM|nr:MULTISPECIES: cytochrome c biogenesis heme-transporting ATPase CcmA [Microbulbifer]QIL89466.1 cytochrome c biogenesis heme-transporting ATPase CcmA [Microbulbifer sp. SH-1]TLM78327.1 cytochrome c biogenesis heme-transporting ATPase CcmA [Microbulbifer harenosus]